MDMRFMCYSMWRHHAPRLLSEPRRLGSRIYDRNVRLTHTWGFSLSARRPQVRRTWGITGAGAAPQVGITVMPR